MSLETGALMPQAQSQRSGKQKTVWYVWNGMAHKRPHDPMFDPGGRLRCDRCAAHDASPEGRQTSKLFSLVYELAGFGRTPEDPDRTGRIPDELHLRGVYYAAYHDRGHLSCAELDLEEPPSEANTGTSPFD